MIRCRQILAVMGEIEPGVRFAILAICVGQFTHKVGFVSPLCSCFPHVSTKQTSTNA